MSRSSFPSRAFALADFDFNDAQQARTQALRDNNGTLELQRMLTASATGYRHMGGPSPMFILPVR